MRLASRLTTRRPYPSHTATSSSSETDSDTDADSQVRHKDPTSRRLLDHALARQYQHMGQAAGRQLDITPPTVRPHEALPPDMRRHVRDRTGKKNRRDLTFQEYICGYARMLLTEIDPHSDLYSKINHLAQDAQDAAVSPWPTVRMWTTTCLDYIQENDATWRDTELFTGERNRIAWAHGRFDNYTPVPCPTFNNDACKQAPPHHEGDMRFLHTCAICYYSAPTTSRAESTSHSAKTCNLKRRNGGRDEWDTNGTKHNGRRNGSLNTGAMKKDAEPKSKN